MLTFAPVIERADAILIVGSGPSAHPLARMRIPETIHIMAVKSAIDGLSRVDSWMTVDANQRTRVHMMSRLRAGVRYYAAVPDCYGTRTAAKPMHRRPAEKGIHWLHRICDTPFGTYGLCWEPDSIHSGNSAYGALGLAFHMQPRRILIAGVDLNHEDYAWKGSSNQQRPAGSMQHVPELFRSARPDLKKRGIETRSCSKGNLDAFPRTSILRGVEWLAAV